MRSIARCVRRCGYLLTMAAAIACSRQKTYVEPWTHMKFVRIPAGQFVMGSTTADPDRRADETPHRVTISRAFYMSVTEVTQAQWTAVMGYNPSFFRSFGPNAPVERVSWNEIQTFLQRLNARGEGHFRLPTEAEWEYACRCGTATVYGLGERLSTDQANYDGRDSGGRYRGHTMAVGSFPSNRWGLFDMNGNVWEWCADEYCPYSSAPARDPVNQCGSRFKVIRGGSWYFGADSARCALRYTHEPQLRGFSLGFRVVRDDNGSTAPPS